MLVLRHIRHWLGCWHGRFLYCKVLTANLYQGAESLWLVYLFLAWMLMLTGIVLGR